MAYNTFSAGVNTSFSSELNDNFDQSIIRANESSIDLTEYTTTATSYVSLVTKTFTPPEGVNAWLMAIKVDVDAKVSDAGDSSDFRGKLTNVTTGGIRYLRIDSSGRLFSATTTSYVAKPMTVFIMESGTNTPYTQTEFLGGASYTVEIEAKNASGHTSYIDNLQLTAYWSYINPVVTSGWS